MTSRQHLRCRAFLQDRENLHGDGNTIAAREGTGMAAAFMALAATWHTTQTADASRRRFAEKRSTMIAGTTGCAREKLRMR
jgi:hypothetical protein